MFLGLKKARFSLHRTQQDPLEMIPINISRPDHPLLPLFRPLKLLPPVINPEVIQHHNLPSL